MIQKDISPEKAIELSKKLNKFSYFANSFYIYASCKFTEIGSEEIVLDVETNPKPLFLSDNLSILKSFNEVSIVFDDDIVELEKMGFKITKKTLYGNEYFYKTENLIKLEGSEYRTFRKDINSFKKNYNFKVLDKYDKNKVIEFMENWHKERAKIKSGEELRIFEYDFKGCLTYLEVMNKIPHEEIYVEIDGKLVGFAIFHKAYENLWVGLMQKTDLNYRGLSKLIYHLKCEKMKETEFFTTGTEAQGQGLAEFKDSLNPVKKLPLYEVSYT